MNRTLKKSIILLSIYLVILLGIILLPGLLLNLILGNAMAVDFGGKYTEIGHSLNRLDSLSTEDRNKALVIRDALSNSSIDEGISCVEFAYSFYNPTEDIPFSEGCYARICLEDEDNNRINYTNNIALVDLSKLCKDETVLNKLSEFTQLYPSGSIKLDKYALDGFECYPLKISFYNNDQVLETITCNEGLDLSGMTLSMLDNVWMNTNMLNEKLSYIQAGRHEAHDRINKIKDKINYSAVNNQTIKKITPFQATVTMVSTQNNYGFLSVTVLHTDKLLSPLRTYTCITWTVLMGIISLIILLVTRKK